MDLVTDGKTADEILHYQTYEIIVLDIALPSLDGLSILKRRRLRGNRGPVLMLTTLDAGADDCLPKPFDFREFDARSRALMRPKQGLASSATKVNDERNRPG